MIHEAFALNKEMFLDNKPEFFHRENFVWKWRGTGYRNGKFGSSMGPTDTFFESGLHELAHMIDFVKRGKLSRIQFHGIHFDRPYADKHYYGGRFYNDEPTTARGTFCEIRTFATQMFLMQKAFGAIYVHASGYEVGQMPQERWAFVKAPGGEDDYVQEMDVEEYAMHCAHTCRLLEDSWAFRNKYVKFPKDAGYEECQLIQEQALFERIMRQYEALSTPFGERRISRALDVVNNRLGKLHVLHQNRRH